MDLEDLLDENRLQQDDWSLGRPKFGKDGQLEVIGWTRKFNKDYRRHYVLRCSICALDKELFGTGYFKSLKPALIAGQIPCGCAKNPRRTYEQQVVLCQRKARELGYTFLGFEGEWQGYSTKIRMLCEKHGEWNTGSIVNLVRKGITCVVCGYDSMRSHLLKPDNSIIL